MKTKTALREMRATGKQPTVQGDVWHDTTVPCFELSPQARKSRRGLKAASANDNSTQFHSHAAGIQKGRRSCALLAVKSPDACLNRPRS
jgi:hypothetical protein